MHSYRTYLVVRATQYVIICFVFLRYNYSWQKRINHRMQLQMSGQREDDLKRCCCVREVYRAENKPDKFDVIMVDRRLAECEVLCK